MKRTMRPSIGNAEAALCVLQSSIDCDSIHTMRLEFRGTVGLRRPMWP